MIIHNKHSGFHAGVRRAFGKDGGGGGTQVKQEIDPQVRGAYLGNVDYAKQVANQMGGRQFAGFDPVYQMGEAQALQAGQGMGRQQLGTAGLLTQAAAGFSPQQMMAAVAGPSALTDSTAYNSAMTQAARANMEDINRYINPFTQNVIDATMSDLERGRQQAVQQIGERAQSARAFGGSRQGVAEALSNREFTEQAGRTISGLRAQGFDMASNLMQQDLARQQQSALANQAALNQAGQFGASARNAAAMSNQAALNQMAQFNAQQQQAANIANQQAGLQGAQFRLGAAQQLGQMGQAQTGADLLSAQTAMGLGGARQQFAQQQMDAARNLGLERLGIMQSALGLQMPGMGGTSSTTAPTGSSNPALGALGGAAIGSQLTALGPYGWAIGGGLGLLGALS